MKKASKESAAKAAAGSKEHSVDLERLRAPFPDADIDWKMQRSGVRNNEPWAIVVPYVDARAIMNRLDEVAGPENWQARFVPTASGMLCELSIRIADEWITKMDGSEETEFEAFKGGISKALVRAAVHWGIGRELYNLPEVFAKFVEKGTAGARWAKIEGREFWWLPNLDRFRAARAALHESGGAAAPEASGVGAAAGPLPMGENQPGDVLVPFGRSQGKRLADLNEAEIAGLIEFYNRVIQPKGRARVFKQQFDAFLAARRRVG